MTPKNAENAQRKRKRASNLLALKLGAMTVAILVQLDVDARVGCDQYLVAFNINQKLRSSFPHRRNGQLDLLVDMTLQETRSILGTKPFFGQKAYRRFGDLQILTLPLHLPSQTLNIQLGNLSDFVHGQRRKDHDL